MFKSLLLSLIVFVLAVSVFPQTNGKVSLIVSYSAKEKDKYLVKFEKFEFLDGKLAQRKVLFSVDEKIAGGMHWLHLDRYILTSNETVFGHRPEDEVSFDLQAGKIVDRKQVPELEKNASDYNEIKSPDGKKGIKTNALTGGADSLVIRIEGKDDLVVNERFDATVKNISSQRPSLPLKWIDNERILTQKKNGSLVIVTLDGKVTPFLEMPCTSDDYPSFRTTKAGKLIYTCGAEYRIDVENKSFEKVKRDMDHEFSSEYIGKKEMYYFKDKPIGGEGVKELTTSGYLATTYGKAGEYGFFDASDMNILNVWNQHTEKWQSYKIDGSYIEILGWHRVDK